MIRIQLQLSRCLLLVTACLSTQVLAYEFLGNRWPNASMEFRFDIPGVAFSGVTWNAALVDALEEWNDSTRFTFSYQQQNVDPCLSDNLNGIAFTDDRCGIEFGKNTLAVTIRRFESVVLGPPAIRESDIIINSTEDFDIYDGNLIQLGTAGLDFRRIMLHELGHVLGLDHESNVVAIMAPIIGNLDRLQEDDIAGADDLYDPAPACPVQLLKYGQVSNELTAIDCKVNELYKGGTDDSPIDLYQLSILHDADYSFAMNSALLDSVLLMADENLNILAFDSKTESDCNSTLDVSLTPGTYYLMANTFVEVANPTCELTGSYDLLSQYQSSQFISLSGSEKLSGGPGFGIFSGGISADSGSSFGNVFASTDAVNIDAHIEIDEQHQGQAGFLVVAALIGQEIYLMNSLGQFILFNPATDSVFHALDKILAEEEALNLISGLVPAALGINEISVDFAVGYGLQNDPAELYFHQVPLNLTVIP